MIVTWVTDSKPIIVGEGQKFEKYIPYYDFIFKKIKIQISIKLKKKFCRINSLSTTW